MTNEEIFELMQRDLDGDLLESEQQLLQRLIQKDAELQLMYNRLKDVSQQLEHLPPVVPPFSIVDSILPKLESAAAKPVAVKSTVNEDILPTLEVKRESSSLPESKKWKRMKVWMASLGSTAVAASLLVGMLFSGGDGKKNEVDSFQNGTDMTPAVVEQPKIPDDPTPPSNNPISSNSKEEEDKTKKSTGAATQTKSKKPPAKNVHKQTPPPKKTNPTPPPKKAVPPTPVMTEDQPTGWPIGLDENPDREDKEPANDDKDDGGDKKEEKDKGKNKEKKKNKDND
ncbi:anti-sigma factor family protein [Brevibacillus porteri]|uniref:anti-sigma factor family protein n=1 Tax=Brevibacillus porteri TaxID=2126350 RepID=UPI00370A6277